MIKMKTRIMIAFVAVIVVSFTGYNMFKVQQNVPFSDIALANVEALANGEGSGTSHTLDCGTAGIKMCRATCGKCNVTLETWGNGKTATLTCSAN